MRTVFMAAVAALAAGCGPADPPHVHGTVTYKGKPVTDKTLVLVFDAPAGESFSQFLNLNPDGSFAGEVPQPGTYKVTIAESRAVQDGFAKPDPNAVPLPSKYRAAITSDITLTIEGKSQTLTIELKD